MRQATNILSHIKHATISASLVVVFALLGIVVGPTTSTNAADLSNFKPGNIISDGVFTNKDTMSASQIQSFLSAKVPTCDTNGTLPASEYGRSDLTHAQYAAMVGWHAPPYTCLKNYRGNTPSTTFCGSTMSAKSNRTAGEVIHDISEHCDINPQVLIVLLQKEQGLVTDSWPLNGQYRSATGYGCPDTAPCDSQYYWLFNQLTWSARMFRAIMDDSPTWYTPYVLGNNSIPWHPNTSSCGYSTVNILNRATASLYNYTPYRPNQAALNAGYGLGNSCSSYGNRNFYAYFVDWFGSTEYTVWGAIGDKYNSLGGAGGTLGDIRSNVYNSTGGSRYQIFENGRIYWSSETGAVVTRGGIQTKYIELSGSSGLLGLPTADQVAPNGTVRYQAFQNGRIYWSSATDAHATRGGIQTKYLALGGHSSSLGLPTTDEINIPDGARYQTFQNGRIYWSSETGSWGVEAEVQSYYATAGYSGSSLGLPTSDPVTLEDDGVIRQHFQTGSVYHYIDGDTYDTHGAIHTVYKQQNAEDGPLGLPTSNEISLAGGARYQTFENGRIYWSSTTGAWSVSGNIETYYASASYSTGPLGLPTGKEITNTNGAQYQAFENGRVYWSSGTDAHMTFGGIQAKYLAAGGDTSVLGLPTADQANLSGEGRYQTFENGRIYWSSETGTRIVRGGIQTKYLELGGDTGFLGLPISDQVVPNSTVRYQLFENGRIYWSASTGAWSVHGAIAIHYLKAGGHKSKLGLPTTGEVVNGSGVRQDFQKGYITWEPGVISIVYN